jgi:hypothetical protein
MSCPDCNAARLSVGHWRTFDPKCLYCGARILQKLGNLQVTNAEIRQRRTAALKVWVDMGHSEAELRALMALPAMTAAPVIGVSDEDGGESGREPHADRKRAGGGARKRSKPRTNR